MGKKLNIGLVLASIALIVAVPLLYSSFYSKLSKIVIKRAFVSAEVVGVSPSYVSGMVTKMYVKAGDIVKKGQLIALIDDTLYRAEVDKKKSKLNSLRLELKQLDNSSDPNRYAQLKAELDVAQKEVRLSELMLSYTRVSSPVNGIIARDVVHVGDTVSPSTVLAYIYDPSTLYVKAYITPDYLVYLHSGEKVKLFDPQSGKSFSGVVQHIGGIGLFSVCNTKPQIPVRITINSKKTEIYFGEPLFVYVKR